MIELLRRIAAEDPDRPAVVDDDGVVSYGRLCAAAERTAAELLRRAVDRFAVVDFDAATVIALLAGASVVGAEPCQYPPTDDPDDVRELAERFAHHVVVTDLDGLGGLSVIAPNDLTGLGRADATVPTQPTGLGRADATVPTQPTGLDELPDVRPLLVLTTGTTGAPRGVRHDWNRMLRGTRRIERAPGQRWLLAYGLHQFAGLQILMHVLAAGATLIAPAPRRPREGLDAMRAHGVTHASATPTYWRFLLAELRADEGPVPALDQITLGGEAVPGPLLDELGTLFPAANISQVYAASEFGSSGSTRDRRSGLPIEVLDRGDDADIAMKVVDGELWVRSRVGMLGYYGDDPIEPDGWRPTGDLVEIVGDRVEFRGRASEIINVGGVKVHPLPIEERVAAVPGVDMARVYGRDNALTGSIVAVDVVLSAGADEAAVREAVRAACADLPAAARPRSVKFVDSVSMTGHKIVRRQS